MANEGDTGYDDSNRAFLQAFMAHSSMTLEEAKPVLAAIFSAQGMLWRSIALMMKIEITPANSRGNRRSNCFP